MKRYYSATKEDSKIKHYHPFYKLLKKIIRIILPKNEFIWKTDKPDDGESIFFVCNHTKIYAPMGFLTCKTPVRVWANYYFIFMKTCWHHMRTKVLIYTKPKWLTYPLGFILTPLIVLTFRAIEPIPVYHKSSKVINDTFDKSIYTMEEGRAQVIFPEATTELANKYLYKLNQGFPLVAKDYYDKTGKCMKFYPVYCAQKLHKFLIGDPITYTPDIPIKIQRKNICEYLEKQIGELGDSLPEHKLVLYV
jgi:hypothetical protein